MLLRRGAEGRLSLDTSRVVIEGNERTVWLRADYDVPDPVPGEPGKQLWGVVTRHRLNCADRTVTDLEMVLLDSAGAAMETDRSSRQRSFDEHPFGMEVFPVVCRRLRS